MTEPVVHPVLHLEQVSAERASGRGPVRVVDAATLSVDAGELVAVMGPSGSGKTSLLHLACGLLAPVDGVVRLDGEAMDPAARARWAMARRRQVGVVHQRLDLLAGLDVLDNVALPLLLDGARVRAAHTQARAALDRLGIGALAPARPAELSMGEQQLVAVARAVAGTRRLVLADEPTAALDTVSAERVVEVLASLAASGTAVLMATHDTRLGSWADRVVYLRDGVLSGAALVDDRSST
jgi:putative ABC transport system ATP-binding protein